VVCQQCGFRNEAGAEFCGSCGTFLEWAGETAADEPAAPAADPGNATSTSTAPVGSSTSSGPPSVATEPSPAPDLIGPPCPVCGKPVPRSRTFCPHCGADTRAPLAAARAAVVEAQPAGRRLPSIGFGPIILVAAFVVVAAGAVLFLPRFLGAGEPVSEATGRPTASVEATEPPESTVPSEPAASSGEAATPDEPPEPSPTPLGNEPPVGADAEAAVVSFVMEFDAAYRVADSAFLLEHLDPAVISAYDQSACRESIESFAKADFTTTVESVSGPTAWTYTPKNGRSTIISVAYTITGERTRAGKTTRLGMHLSFNEGRFFWFASSC